MTESTELDPTPERLDRLLASGDLTGLAEAVVEMDLHPSDVADLLEHLDSASQVGLVRVLPTELASEALAEMEDGEERADLLAALDPAEGAELLHEMADDDAADLIAGLEPADANRILSQLPVEEAGDLRGLLLYDEETAGGIMTTELVAVQGELSASQALEEIRRQGQEVEDFYTVFVVDDRNRLLGTVPLGAVVVAAPEMPVAELVEEAQVTILPDTDQEEVGRLMSRYNLVSAPVVNEFGHLMGRITFDDIIDVLEAEQTEDILRLAGVSDEEEVKADWQDAVRTRLPWLALNLVTITVASSVVILFEGTITRFWYLAMLLPIVGGMGGNSGTQALAVTIRRIALASSELERRSDAVSKELLVGLVNGLALGLMAAGAAWVLHLQTPAIPATLPFVVMGALWGNILLSGFAGAFIPTLLNRAGIDPAVASSVFLTTFTDLVGFALLLGLATALLG
jgi:magnesium transporter